MSAEQNARTLFNKRWAEPTDQRFVAKWIEANKRDAMNAMRRAERERYVLEHGVNAGETWSTARDG